ncbi:methionyl-tRNA formyltransferase [Candidatus Gottesmanbacteria bacterium]|nr:methionyl-tRNA formyltransferase [Candidatus Gottesmanbacteria bacterium]
MTSVTTVFFGSTNESVLVLEKLLTSHLSRITVVAVVTQPPRPMSRKQIVSLTPVETWAKDHGIPTLSFPSHPEKPWLYENEKTVTGTLQPLQVDLLISASYGQKIPWPTIMSTKHGGLNVHPSLLPRWRGADPVPWAILSGDNQTGVTIVTLAEHFDEGNIIAQKKIPILPTDTTTILYPKLFTLGAELLIDVLPDYLSGKNRGKPQVSSHHTHHTLEVIQLRTSGISSYARRLTRDDGFEPWKSLQQAMETGNDASRIDRKFRALDPWPGIWTLLGQKRLKILKLHLRDKNLVIDTVQLEGKNPIPFSQFSSVYLLPS